MAKTLSCSDLGNDCDFAALADTEQELMELVREHAARVHGVEEMTPELREQVQEAMQEV